MRILYLEEINIKKTGKLEERSFICKLFSGENLVDIRVRSRISIFFSFSRLDSKSTPFCSAEPVERE